MKTVTCILRGCTFLYGLLFILNCSPGQGEDDQIHYVNKYLSFTQLAELPLRDLPKREAWRKAVPEVEEISIPRNNGEPGQPALWYHSGTAEKKPLFLVLHSWSADYLQHYGITYGEFAAKNDWIFIHPNYHGSFDDPDAAGSEKAVQDVLAALNYAKEHAPVDEDRIYLAGFSGGAMMSLIMVGRYPEKFTAALAWVPVYDLNDWYNTVIRSEYDYTDKYKKDIETACGGNPNLDRKALRECKKRSPQTYLVRARGKGTKVLISSGIKDPFVPPSHSVRVFNDLAGKVDRISTNNYHYLDRNKFLPEGLKGQAEDNQFFSRGRASHCFFTDFNV